MTRAQLWIALGILSFLMVTVGAITLVSASGGDAEQVLRFVTNSALPLIGLMLVGAGLTRTESKVTQAAQDIQAVKVQTNGQLDALIDRVAAAEQASGVIDATEGRHEAPPPT